MNTDSLNNLVEGWTFDKATGEFVLGETEDYWSFEDGFLVRKPYVVQKLHLHFRRSTTSSSSRRTSINNWFDPAKWISPSFCEQQGDLLNWQGSMGWQNSLPAHKRSSAEPTPALCW